jgi:peptide deformylase
MALREIIVLPDKRLRQVSDPVKAVDAEVRALVDDMFETMYKAPGVGLAANQIGVALRVAVIDLSVGEDPQAPFVMVNPKIVDRRGKQLGEEGCLSVPKLQEVTPCPEWTRVEALDRHGKPFAIEGEELMARALTHEIGHLDGHLYIHRLSPLKRGLIKKKMDKCVKTGVWEDVYP